MLFCFSCSKEEKSLLHIFCFLWRKEFKMKKSISVNESSIIDLKAELFRKEEHFRQKQSSHLTGNQQQQQAKGSKTLDKLALLTGKKKIAPKRSVSNEKNISVNSSQDEEEYKKAKLRLQSKAEIYEKLKSGELEDVEDESGESLYLVDFLKKSATEDPSISDEEWVEFEDSLGRQRKCLKKDLEKFKDADPLFRPVEKNPAVSSMQLEEAHREMMKKKWEQEQEEMTKNPQTDIHYQNVQFDEVREHGVGYYQFSKEESERKAQMESLNKLREQTIEQRAKREQIKSKRQAVLAARLAKVLQKKLKKQLPSDVDENPVTEPEINEKASERGDIKNSSSFQETHAEQMNKTTNVVNELVSRADSAVKNSLGFSAKLTAPKSSATRWIETQRDERNPEFAPPSIYDQPHSPRGRANLKNPWKSH